MANIPHINLFINILIHLNETKMYHQLQIQKTKSLFSYKKSQ